MLKEEVEAVEDEVVDAVAEAELMIKTKMLRMKRVKKYSKVLSPRKAL